MRYVYVNPWFSVVKADRYHYIQEKNACNGAAVLLFKADKLLLINVKRAPFNSLQWEIPRGYGEIGETPISCAVREVYEETGYRIELDQLQYIGKVKPNSSILQSEVTLFQASLPDTDIADSTLDQEEGIQKVKSFSFDEIRFAIERGELTDGFTLSALGCFLLTSKKHFI